MSNIYDGCLDNKEILESISFDELCNEMNERLSKSEEGQNVIFVDVSNGIVYGARVVVYNGEVPDIMKNYKRKYIKIDGKWARECLLGICDKCHSYTELISLTNDGKLCRSCSKFDFQW